LKSEYGVNVSLRSVYQHFSELSKMQLVKGTEEREGGGRRRKVFRITDVGLSLIR
jgi:DNA-binding PadR family transcriptional regulator